MDVYIYRRTIFLRETDATGVLYFSEQLKLGLEALEAYFLTKKFTLQQMIAKGDFLMPIVHAEVDFCLPLFVGDEVEIHLSLEEIGTSSFTLKTRCLKGGVEAATTKIIHVAIGRESGKTIPVPELVLTPLRQL
ncbi:MAG: 1,4-dihydroxy-2-naphthoyl-CoA hydrolase [Chlamydiae bacterium]|nr:1,4-dihydroxy-2-naphthoyl-CoA hydrolase [Chlamydiota bacterium]